MLDLLAKAAAAIGGPGSASSDQLAQTSPSTFQGGSLVVGVKQVGGTGNSAGATSASQAQVPPIYGATVPAASVPGVASSGFNLDEILPWLIGAALLILGGFALSGGRSRKAKK